MAWHGPSSGVCSCCDSDPPPCIPAVVCPCTAIEYPPQAIHATLTPYVKIVITGMPSADITASASASGFGQTIMTTDYSGINGTWYIELGKSLCPPYLSVGIQGERRPLTSFTVSWSRDATSFNWFCNSPIQTITSGSFQGQLVIGTSCNASYAQPDRCILVQLYVARVTPFPTAPSTREIESRHVLCCESSLIQADQAYLFSVVGFDTTINADGSTGEIYANDVDNNGSASFCGPLDRPAVGTPEVVGTMTSEIVWL